MAIKSRTWYAAGDELDRAFNALSDGAFRLYVHLCRSADYKTGSVDVLYREVATRLNRSLRSVVTHFNELREKGVCSMDVAPNQYSRTRVVICAPFWAYTRSSDPILDLEVRDYVAAVGKLLQSRACFRGSFGQGDQDFARKLFKANISLEIVERAIHLGCARRYLSSLETRQGTPILSLNYFRDVIDEVRTAILPPQSLYWEYLQSRVVLLEKIWGLTAPA